MTTQGFPTAIELLGMSFVTTEFAPIVTLFPIVTSGKTVAFAPIQTWLPIVIGFPFTCLLKFVTSWLEEMIETPGASSTLFPKIIPLLAWM